MTFCPDPAFRIRASDHRRRHGKENQRHLQEEEEEEEEEATMQRHGNGNNILENNDCKDRRAKSANDAQEGINL